MPNWWDKVSGAALGGLQTASDAFGGARYLLAPDASEQAGDALQDAAGRPVEAKSLRGFVENLGPSAVKLVGGTVKGAFDLGSNAFEMQTNPAKWAAEVTANPGVQAALADPGKVASGVKDALAKRYGGLEAIGNTAYEDPFGLASDVAAVATLGGGAAAKAPGVLGRMGRGLSAAGAAVDPIAQLSRATELRAPLAHVDDLALEGRASKLPAAVEWKPRIDDTELPAAREWTPPTADDLPPPREWKPRPRPPGEGQTGFEFDVAPPRPKGTPDEEALLAGSLMEWTPPKAGPDVVAPTRRRPVEMVDAIDPNKYASSKQAMAEKWGPLLEARRQAGYPDLPLTPQRPATNARPGTARYGVGLDREGKIAERERLVFEGLRKAKKTYADAPHLYEGLQRGLATTHPRHFAHSNTGRKVKRGQVANYEPLRGVGPDDVKVGTINMHPNTARTAAEAEGIAYHEGGGHGGETLTLGKDYGDRIYNELNEIFGYWPNPQEIASRQKQLFHPAWNAQRAAQPMLPAARPIMQSFARNEAELQGVVNQALTALQKSSPKLRHTSFREPPRQGAFDFGYEDDALEAAMAGLQRSLR